MGRRIDVDEKNRGEEWKSKENKAMRRRRKVKERRE